MNELDTLWSNFFDYPEVVNRWQEYARKVDKKVGAFLQFAPQLGLSQAANTGSLKGVPFAVKDNIAVQSFQLSCGSRMLRKLTAPYTATAVGKLQAAGGVVVGKTNLDEFGMGSSTTFSALGETFNPWDLSRVAGGSSGGSAAAVATGIVPFALGSDTGGSIRQPASFCGLYGLKPTYGVVSRYGLVAYASSLEGIGVISRKVDTAEKVFNLMRGQDERDHSSIPYRPPSDTPESFKVGIPVECAGSESGDVAIHEDVREALEETRGMLLEFGFTVEEISLPTLDFAVSAYYVISTAEASANLARFDGIRYGERVEEADNPEDLIVLSRSRGLGEEVKLRILLGTYVLRSGFQDQYYLRAQKIRTAIRRDFEKAFKTVDLVLMPVYPYPPFKLGEGGLDPFMQKLADIFTICANLSGLPAMSFPVAVKKGLPIGMQFMAPPFAEGFLFRACSRVEEVFPAPKPPLFSTDWSEFECSNPL